MSNMSNMCLRGDNCIFKSVFYNKMCKNCSTCLLHKNKDTLKKFFCFLLK